jgi:carbon storage regulator CsrA
MDRQSDERFGGGDIGNLMLGRELGQAILIGEGPDMVRVVYHRLDRGQIKLLVQAPKHIPVDREEVRDRIEAERHRDGPEGGSSRFAGDFVLTDRDNEPFAVGVVSDPDGPAPRDPFMPPDQVLDVAGVEEED